MNKKELTAQVVDKTGIPVVAASKIINAIFNIIKVSLENGESVVFQGFGSFSVVNRSERKGINPSTLKSMTIPARKVVKFTSSKKIVVK